MEQLEWARDLALRMWDLGKGLDVINWVAILLAILVVQTTFILRSARRRSGAAITQQFEEINTRLNMVIFELRQIRGAYSTDEDLDEDDDSAAGEDARDFKVAAE